MSVANAAALLRSRLLGDVSQWAGAAVTWRRLQGELATRRTEEGRRGERERGDEESSEAPTLKRERDEEEEKESERKRRCEEDDGGEEASAENMHHGIHIHLYLYFKRLNPTFITFLIFIIIVFVVLSMK